jgi:hypothetical protein
MTYPVIADKTYNVYTAEMDFHVPTFTQVVQPGYTRAGATTCAYDVSYTIALAD